MGALLSLLAVRNSRALIPSKHAYNLAPFSYYRAVYPFINVVKSGAPALSSYSGSIGTVNADGWCTALPVSSTALVTVVLSMDPINGYFPAGSYKIVSSSAATLSIVAGPGISSIVPGVGTATFTFTAQPGAWDAVVIKITTQNATGSAIAVTDLACYATVDETAYLAGAIFRPAYLADLAGAKTVRFMDWLQTNNNFWANLTDMGSQNESRVSYANSESGAAGDISGYAPFSICMKLAKAVGAHPWINVPQGGGWRFFTTTVASNTINSVWSGGDATALAHGFTANERIMFCDEGHGVPGLAPLVASTIYYVKNPTTYSFQVSLTSGGAAVTLTYGSNSTQGTNNYATVAPLDTTPQTSMRGPIASLCYATDPNAIVYVEDSNEVWNYSFDQTQYTLAASKALAGDNGSGYAYEALNCWAAFEAVYPPSQIVRVMAGQAAGFETANFAYTDHLGIISSGKTVSQILSASLSRCCYAFAPYINCAVNAGDHANTVTPPLAYTANGNTTAIPDAYWDSKFNNGITDATGWSSGSYSGAQTAVPGIAMTCYEWGHQFFWRGSDIHAAAIGNNLATYLDGAAGGAMYQRAYSAVLAPFNVSLINHYFSTGSYQLDNTGTYIWGIKGQESAATARWNYFQSL